MNAILLAAALLGQCNYGYSPRYTERFSGSWYAVRFYAPMHSPWNAAVAELRAKQAPRTRTVSPGTMESLQSLAAEKDRLWIVLLESEPADKEAARNEYRIVKQRLELARVVAAREIR